MKEAKRKKLEAAGYAVSDAADFLGLTAEEALLVEMRVALGDAIKERRVKLKISQTDFAERIHSSQSRVAKMEAAEPGVSLDLLIRGLAATGADLHDVAAVLTKHEPLMLQVVGRSTMKGSYRIVPGRRPRAVETRAAIGSTRKPAKRRAAAASRDVR